MEIDRLMIEAIPHDGVSPPKVAYVRALATLRTIPVLVEPAVYSASVSFA